MQTKVTALLIGLFLLAGSAFAQKPKVYIGAGPGTANFRVPYHQTANRSLSKDTAYVLTGWYFVDSTKTITIEAGTTIFGDSASGGTLIVSRGAKINAQGTSVAPIVCTSGKLPGQRKPGDWGGVIILGAAPTNRPATQQIEGGFGTIANTNAWYGGADPNDSSGVLSYIRIEFAGIAFAQDNEINGLTFGGVGSKTKVDHIQVSFANDDGMEFFGGTVQAKYLIDWRSLDDTYDTDFGFSGKLQFILTKRDPLIFDASASGSSNGFESDNEGSSPFSATPRTSVKISNATILGPQSDTTVVIDPKWDHVAMLRRATELSIYNSILSGYSKGIQLRDTLTQRAAIDGILEIRNTILQGPYNSDNLLTLSSSPNTGNIAGFDAKAWFTTPAFADTAAVTNPTNIGLKAAAFTLNATFDPVPSASTMAATKAASFSGGRLNGDTWFTQVTYVGAFDPSLPMSSQWTAGWTNFDPQNANYLTAVEETSLQLPETFVLEQNFPNPFNASTAIRFSLPQAGKVQLKIYDLLGREVATLVDELTNAGSHTVTFDASRLATGVYFYSLSSGNFSQVRKMTLVK